MCRLGRPVGRSPTAGRKERMKAGEGRRGGIPLMIGGAVDFPLSDERPRGEEGGRDSPGWQGTKSFQGEIRSRPWPGRNMLSTPPPATATPQAGPDWCAERRQKEQPFQ
ncbi:hypothetical protein NDU88_003371 [Pleurodeles waltl]|uniref:Uncharacterized protein n=1 Tax=Pleurodeles waltl TaxID=8319 RepID=A0AAV7UZV9_PLEWA|nr:hypothetical protein NDU88_003371 [Pleurodeles waltl]